MRSPLLSAIRPERSGMNEMCEHCTNIDGAKEKIVVMRPTQTGIVRDAKLMVCCVVPLLVHLMGARSSSAGSQYASFSQGIDGPALPVMHDNRVYTAGTCFVTQRYLI